MATRSEKLRLARWVHKWRRRLLLHHWTVDVEFSDAERLDDPKVRADATTDHKYQKLLITIYPRFFDFTIVDQQVTVIHELMHILTDGLHDLAMQRRRPTRKAAGDAVEVLTEHVASILWTKHER